jgi:morphogenetic protein associated with SpoVID
LKIHMVKEGDTLYELSKKYGVELDKVIAMNPQIADPDKLVIGMKVKIPAPPKPVETPIGEIAHKHVVVQGDTLWKLSKQWGIPLATMIKANPQLKNPNVLLTGETVLIPKLGTETPHTANTENPGVNAENPGSYTIPIAQVGEEPVAENPAAEAMENEMPPKLEEMPNPGYQAGHEANPPFMQFELPAVEAMQPEMPMMNEPMMNEPMMNEPMMNAPMMNAPMMNAPMMNAPMMNEPMMNEPMMNEPMMNAPMMNEPMMNAPMMNAPMMNAPMMNEPMMNAPMMNEPMMNAPMMNAPMMNAPMMNAPMMNSPMMNAPMMNAPMMNEPIANMPFQQPTFSMENAVSPHISQMLNTPYTSYGAFDYPIANAPEYGMPVPPSTSGCGCGSGGWPIAPTPYGYGVPAGAVGGVMLPYAYTPNMEGFVSPHHTAELDGMLGGDDRTEQSAEEAGITQTGSSTKGNRSKQKKAGSDSKPSALKAVISVANGRGKKKRSRR